MISIFSYSYGSSLVDIGDDQGGATFSVHPFDMQDAPIELEHFEEGTVSIIMPRNIA
jgi:hypothetical protein